MASATARGKAVRIIRLLGLLLPVVYVGLLLTTAVHEVAGHGLVALAVGGTFSGFMIHLRGSGWAFAYPAPESPLWHLVAINAAGIVVTTALGAAMCMGVRLLWRHVETRLAMLGDQRAHAGGRRPT